MSTPWSVVKERLEASGAIVNGIGRRAQARVCKRCHERTITGLDGETCALLAEVDPTPLSTLGEVVAQLQGRRTYALSSEGGRLVLNGRDDWRIAYRPAGSGTFDVLPEHRCHEGPLPAAESSIAARHRTDYPDQPPY